MLHTNCNVTKRPPTRLYPDGACPNSLTQRGRRNHGRSRIWWLVHKYPIVLISTSIGRFKMHDKSGLITTTYLTVGTVAMIANLFPSDMKKHVIRTCNAHLDSIPPTPPPPAHTVHSRKHEFSDVHHIFRCACAALCMRCAVRVSKFLRDRCG